MGPPPNYLITRKLVRHFFKKYLPTKPLNQIDPSAGLEDTIIRFGVDHPQTRIALEKLDEVDEQALAYKKKIQDMRIKERMMGLLRKPRYSFHEKGRFRDDFFVRGWDIYDGVRRNK